MSDNKIIPALILAAGIASGAGLLGAQFKNLRQPGTITVKGLAEAQHNATLGTWRVGVEAWGQDYAAALKANEKNLAVLQGFLKKQGFPDDALQQGEVDVSSHSESYYDDNGRERTRKNGYDATRYITVTTKDLAALQKALSAIQGLRAENENITFGEPKYFLDNLESIKRDLIAKATQDAKVRADEFAKTGNARVGAMTSASQGSFDIKAAGVTDEDGDDSYGGSYSTSTIEKKVRLVVTIQYTIE